MPPLHDHESPASWVTRAALSQGVSADELMAYFGLPVNCDPDLMIVGSALPDVIERSGLSMSSFSFAEHMFSGLKSIDPNGENLLLWTKNGRSRYRFCPLCLHESDCPYFPLHWRFKAWRWCPIHDCLLSDYCPHCHREVILPGSMITGGRKNEGVPYLNQCLHCAENLDADLESAERVMLEESFRGWEEAVLINGRAVLAAVFHRKFSIIGRDRQYELKDLMRLKQIGLVPLDLLLLPAINLRSNY